MPEATPEKKAAKTPAATPVAAAPPATEPSKAPEVEPTPAKRSLEQDPPAPVPVAIPTTPAANQKKVTKATIKAGAKVTSLKPGTQPAGSGGHFDTTEELTVSASALREDYNGHVGIKLTEATEFDGDRTFEAEDILYVYVGDNPGAIALLTE